MRIEQIKSEQSFGIYKKHSSRSVGNERIDSVFGKTAGQHITVYSQYTDGILMSKLHYVADKFDNFIKLKLTQFKDGKKLKTLIKAKKNPLAFQQLLTNELL